MNHYLVYAKKYKRMGIRYGGKRCEILVVAKGKPLNVLVKIEGGELLIVPYGNIREEVISNEKAKDCS